MSEYKIISTFAVYYVYLKQSHYSQVYLEN